MSITVEKSPSLVDLSGNYLPLWLSSNNEFSTAGTKFVAQLEFFGIPTNGQQAKLTWQGGDYEFLITFSNTPDESGAQVGISSVTTPAWVTNELLPALQANYELDKYFVITNPISRHIVLEARTEGSDGIITFDGMNAFGAGFPKLTFGGVNPVRRPDFGIQVVLEYAPLISNTFARHLKFLTTINGKAKFELSDPLKYLHQNLLPQLGQSGFINLSANVLQYKIRYMEAYGQGETSKMSSPVTKYLLPGGRTKAEVVRAPDFYQEWMVNQAGPIGQFGVPLYSKLLTLDTVKKVGPNDPLLINYFHNQPLSDIRLRAEIVYTDGSTATHTLANKTQAIPFSLWAIEVGYQKVLPFIDSTKTLAYYNVFLANPAKPYLISSKLKVQLLSKIDVDTVHLLYRNSPGVHEIFTTRGHVVFSTEFSKAQAQKNIKYPTSVSQRTFIDVNNTFNDWAEVYTGFKNEFEIEGLKDVLNSRDVYIYQGGWVPVSIQQEKLSRKETYGGRSYGHKITLKYEPENYHS